MTEHPRIKNMDTEIRRMLEVFAGPVQPSLPATRAARHRITRRFVFVVAASLVALAVAVPSSLRFSAQ